MRTVEDQLEAASHELRTQLEQIQLRPASAVSRRARRRRLTAAAVAFALTLGVVGGTAVLLSGRTETSPTIPAAASDDGSAKPALPEAATSPTPASIAEGTFDLERIQRIQAALADGELDLIMDELSPTADEIAEAERRNSLKAALRPSVVIDAIGATAFSGLWFDNETGTANVMISATANLEEVEAALEPLGDGIAVLQVTYSYDELKGFYELLLTRAPDNSSIGLYVKRNQIGIGIDDPTRIDTSGVPNDAIFFEPFQGIAESGAGYPDE